MKTKILLTLGIFFCINGFAQHIKIEDQRIKEKDDNVFVTFTLVVEKPKSNERLTLTPVLYSGDKSKNLTPVIITGRNRSISDKRQSASVGIRTKNNQRIPYSVTLPYESWMGDISLRIDRKRENCCTEQMLASQTIVVDKPIRYDVIVPEIELIQAEASCLEKFDAETSFLAPMREYKTYQKDFDAMRAEGVLIVRFGQGKSAIDSNFEDNAKSLEQVRRVIELIEQDSGASLGKIVLAGASSPEGSAKVNYHLAQKRVDVLRQYLVKNVSDKADLFESVNIGEDWGGLRKMVEQSDMQYREDVLRIIDNYTVEQGREVELMKLKWGRPYNYMLEHFFPKLRNAGYIRIFYESKPSPEFVSTNQAIEQYNQKQYNNALSMLEGVAPTAVTETVCGVCYLMLGEYDKAETALYNALRLGSTQAVELLEQLKKLKAVERQ